MADRKASLKDEYAKSSVFVRRFLTTYEAVVRESEESKVELFANLLSNAPTQEQLDESTFKALQQILTEVTVRELRLLKIIEEPPKTPGADWAGIMRPGSDTTS